jgi:hypothetical protein
VTKQVRLCILAFKIQENTDGCPDQADNSFEQPVGLNSSLDMPEVLAREKVVKNPLEALSHRHQAVLRFCNIVRMRAHTQVGLIDDLCEQSVLQLEEVLDHLRDVLLEIKPGGHP